MSFEEELSRIAGAEVRINKKAAELEEKKNKMIKEFDELVFESKSQTGRELKRELNKLEEQYEATKKPANRFSREGILKIPTVHEVRAEAAYINKAWRQCPQPCRQRGYYAAREKLSLLQDTLKEWDTRKDVVELREKMAEIRKRAAQLKAAAVKAKAAAEGVGSAEEKGDGELKADIETKAELEAKEALQTEKGLDDSNIQKIGEKMKTVLTMEGEIVKTTEEILAKILALTGDIRKILKKIKKDKPEGNEQMKKELSGYKKNLNEKQKKVLKWLENAQKYMKPMVLANESVKGFKKGLETKEKRELLKKGENIFKEKMGEIQKLLKAKTTKEQELETAEAALEKAEQEADVETQTKANIAIEDLDEKIEELEKKIKALYTHKVRFQQAVHRVKEASREEEEQQEAKAKAEQEAAKRDENLERFNDGEKGRKKEVEALKRKGSISGGRKSRRRRRRRTRKGAKKSKKRRRKRRTKKRKAAKKSRRRRRRRRR